MSAQRTMVSALNPRTATLAALLALGAVGSASAAPWPINVQVPLPSNPANVQRFGVQSAPVLSMEDLSPVFSLAGQAQQIDEDGESYQHLHDGADHAYVYLNGGAVFHATSVLGSESAIQPRPNSQVWGSAAGLLNALEINGYGPFTLVQAGIGKGEVKIHTPDGTVIGPYTTHQMASYKVKLNGAPTFGGGSDVSVVYGQGAQVGAFSHALRNLIGGGIKPCKSAAQALDDFSERADLYNRFTVLRGGLEAVSHVDITGVMLGYYLPDLATHADTIEPVWELRGTMVGLDEQGNAATMELLWYEPALQDAVLPDLGIWGDPMVYEANAPLPGSIEKPEP